MLICCLTLPTTRPEEFLPKTPFPVPSSIDLSAPPPRPPSDGHFTHRPERSDYLADEGWRWQEEIQAWADCHHVLSPMGFKRQKPSQHDEPPIPGPSPSSKPPEDVPTREPEPEVAPTQFMEEPFACPSTPRSIIIIDNTLHSYPGSFPEFPYHCRQEPNHLLPPVQSSSHSYNDARQEYTNL
ncbi:hypothetical protein O181_056025 [Austropuccinia psidii MF-1]|uniref:Uncharacterized protein n=1 Tax=Austropuccinia psidii MF-1 TaxID=1389203 RepID=A0A9Q3HVR9_9BASI|nr:hypothetical protein [Austropuccinia psidii MF-1]